MLLSGHDAPISTVKFDPSGRYLASGSHDKRIFLWNVQGDCENFNVLDGHKNVILDLEWNSSGAKIVSASADKTVGVFDIMQGKRQKKYSGHSSVVNSVSMSRCSNSICVSGSDDAMAFVWDFRSRNFVQKFESEYAITAVSYSGDDNYVFTSGIDNVVKAWDTRTESVLFIMEGHKDTVTGMSLSPDGSKLLTNSMDKTLICWDARPHNTDGRLLKTFEGAQHNLEKTLLKCSWSPDGEMVSCGSSDHVCHIWDVPTTEELYYLPGHAGSVNEVSFHPSEPIIASCGSDKQIYLGEL
jgi:Prp8 binding protein